MSWDLVVGLEVHAQVVSRSKLFSSGSVGFGANPNSQVQLLDVGMPGTLPVLNSFCVEQAVKTAHALGCKVNLRSRFDRKNYFYPDLPLGYQITQFFTPIAEDGAIEIACSNGTVKKVGVERIHLEQDAAKIIHDETSGRSYIDFNRAGVALMEIVSAPEMNSIEEIVKYIENLRMILRYIGSCDGDMEKGSFRCDANVSVRPNKESPLGVRCEIKNLNSINYISSAVTYEMERQVSLIESGGKVIQETRLFDVKTGETVRMRDKESSSDYSYFPDPDLSALVITKDYVDKIYASLPELPASKRLRYMRDLNLNSYDASILVSEKEYAQFFEDICQECEPKIACNWLINEFLGRLNKRDLSIKQSGIKADRFANMLSLIEKKVISGSGAKKLLDAMFESDKPPMQLVDDLGLAQIEDESQIASVVDNVLSQHQKEVAAYKAGKERLLGFFVGQVMKQTKGKANPELVNTLLKARLK